MRWAAAITTFALLLGVADAHAFVTPRWNAQRESRRSTLIGKWSAITYKKLKSAQKIDDPGLLIVFTPTELRVEDGSWVEKASWKIVRQEADLLGLDVVDDKGRHHAIDVLVEGSDALTMYLQDDDGDDEESVRLERVH